MTVTAPRQYKLIITLTRALLTVWQQLICDTLTDRQTDVQAGRQSDEYDFNNAYRHLYCLSFLTAHQKIVGHSVIRSSRAAKLNCK